MDRRIDDLAEQAANLINHMPDVATKEYGFLIWADAQGGLHLSSLIQGDNFGLTGLSYAFLQSEGIQPSQVVGMIHSHPTLAHVFTPDGAGLRYNPDGSPYYLPVTPESHFELPSTGDWDWIDNVFSENNPRENMMRNYILHDGVLNEYDLYNNPHAGTAQQRRDASNQATNANGSCP